MLRVQRFEEPHGIKLRMEGVLGRDTHQQCEREIQAAFELLDGRRLLADVGNLVIIDEVGTELIRALPLRGVEFSAVPAPIQHLLESAAEQGCRQECTRLQRLVFQISQVTRSAPPLVRDWVCGLLRSVLPPALVLRYVRWSKLCDSR